MLLDPDRQVARLPGGAGSEIARVFMGDATLGAAVVNLSGDGAERELCSALDGK
jgi:hypothetical protein